MYRNLVVYYSFSKHTQGLAETIALLLDSDILEIIPKKLYSFEKNTATKEVRNEVSRGFCPELLSGNGTIDGYDIIFVGTLNWFKAIAPPSCLYIMEGPHKVGEGIVLS